MVRIVARRADGLQFGKELQEGVARLVSADLARGGRQLIQRALFGFEVGFNVAMRGFDALVTEPERDYGNVDPGLKQVHCGRMPHDVRAYPLGCQVRARSAGFLDRAL